MNEQYPTREQWLTAAKQLLEQRYFTKPSRRLPPVAVSCGIPAGSIRAIGQCWDQSASSEKVTEIFICPSITDPMDVMGTLLHELVHASVGVKEKHGTRFVKLAREVGLREGSPKCCGPDEACKQELTPLLQQLGTYPHSKLNKVKTKKVKPPKKRIKYFHPATKDYAVTVPEELIETHGVPHTQNGEPFLTKQQLNQSDE